MKLLFTILLLYSIFKTEAQATLSIGGGLGYNHCFYMHKDETSKFSNPEFQVNFSALYFTESPFFIGLQIINHQKGIRVIVEDFKEQQLFDFTIFERRIGLLAGLKNLKKVNPFVSLNISNYRNDAYNVDLQSKYYVPDSKFSKLNPSIELGCNFITSSILEKKISLINRISIRYTPLSMFRGEDKINYINSNFQKISTPFYNKMVDIAISMSIHYNKHFKD